MIKVPGEAIAPPNEKPQITEFPKISTEEQPGRKNCLHPTQTHQNPRQRSHHRTSRNILSPLKIVNATP